MVRVKRGVITHKKHKKLLNNTRGYYGARSKTYKVAKQAYIKSGQYAYIDRKRKKRIFRRLWILKINAFLRNYGFNYSTCINLLKKNNILINRKSLLNIINSDPVLFLNEINKLNLKNE